MRRPSQGPVGTLGRAGALVEGRSARRRCWRRWPGVL